MDETMDGAELMFAHGVVAGAVATAARVAENTVGGGTSLRGAAFFFPGVSFAVATIITRNPVYGVVAAGGNVWLRNWNGGF
jgi:hypothetical protein